MASQEQYVRSRDQLRLGVRRHKLDNRQGGQELHTVDLCILKTLST
jgi:hypothetical protein